MLVGFKSGKNGMEFGMQERKMQKQETGHFTYFSVARFHIAKPVANKSVAVQNKR